MEGDTDNADGGRPADESQLSAENEIRAERIAARKPSVKRLLDQYGETWLFAVTEGSRTHYQVERGDRCWRFSLEYSARSKFTRELRRQGGTV